MTASTPMSVAESYAQSIWAARARQLAQAAADYRKAEEDLVAAREDERIAREAKIRAYQRAKELMDGESELVIGDMILAVNANGGINIRKVRVLPLEGVQPCLL